MTVDSSKKITLLSFVFTMVIVCYHSNITIVEYYRTEWLGVVASNFWEFAANISMLFFFMLTGFLLYNGALLSNIKDKLKRRIWSIVIPFLIWNTVYYIISVVQHGFRDDLLVVLYRFSFDPYDGPLWYLFVITILSLFAPIVLKLKDKTWFKILIITICILASMVFSFEFFTSRSCSHLASWCERFCRYFTSYVLGGAVALYSFGWIDIKHKLWWLLLPVSLLSVLWIVKGNIIPTVFKLLTLILAPVIVWNVARTKSFSISFARNAFFIYAIHRLIVTGLVVCIGKLYVQFGVNQTVLLDLICLLFPFFVSFAIWLLADVTLKGLKQFHLELVYKLLTGGRK